MVRAIALPPSPSGYCVWIELQFRVDGFKQSVWEWHSSARGMPSRLFVMSQLRQSSEATALRFVHSAVTHVRATYAS